jgi:hypothetical protein
MSSSIEYFYTVKDYDIESRSLFQNHEEKADAKRVEYIRF